MKQLGYKLAPLLLGILFLLTNCSSSGKKINVQGYIDARYVYLTPTVSGQLQHLGIYRGNDVTAGQLLAQLDPSPEADQLVQAQHELESAQQELLDRIRGSRDTILLALSAKQKQNEANLLLAQQDLERKKYLYQKTVIAKAEYDDAVAKYETTRQAVEEAKQNYNEAVKGNRENKILEQQAVVDAQKANVERLKWYVSQKKLYAPLTAKVFDTFFEEGEYVGQGQSVLALLAAKNIRIVFFLPERDLSQIQLGTPLTFTCDGCPKSTSATINYISAQAEYTPPVIYSQETRDKLVYRVEAIMPEKVASAFHPGQPISIELFGKKHGH